MENQIKAAAKLYECRDTAKRFFKEEFYERIKPYQHLIQAVQKRQDKEVLPAMMECIKISTGDEGMKMMMFMAAAVELIEPSNPETKNQN